MSFHCVLIKLLSVNTLFVLLDLKCVIPTLHGCPWQMNENLVISNSELTSDSELIGSR